MTVFPSGFNNIYLKYFGILQNWMRNYDILWKITIVDDSYDIPQYFFVQIPCFCSVSFDCDVLFAFHNFVPWWMKFNCLLLYHFASRQYRQIFRHRQTIGDISNIADTYILHVFYDCYSSRGALLHKWSKIVLLVYLTKAPLPLQY